MVKRQIIAMGGGGFSMEPRNKRLDTYILAQAISSKPKICFIPTASGDSRNYIERFYRYFNRHTCVTNHLEYFLQEMGKMDQKHLSRRRGKA